MGECSPQNWGPGGTRTDRLSSHNIFGNNTFEVFANLLGEGSLRFSH